jgi:hypothetical protein
LRGAEYLLAAAPAIVEQGPVQVSGVLRDASTGEPVGGGTVAFAYGGPGGFVQSGISADDETGTFVISDLPRCALYLVARAPGFGQAVAFLIADPSLPQEIDFRMVRSGSIEGAVVDGLGAPIGGAVVSVSYQDQLKDRLAEVSDVVERARLEGLKIVTFDASEHRGGHPSTSAGEGKGVGEFRIQDVDADRPFRLVARHPEHGDVTSDVLTLQPGGRMVGVRLVVARSERRLY